LLEPEGRMPTPPITCPNCATPITEYQFRNMELYSEYDETRLECTKCDQEFVVQLRLTASYTTRAVNRFAKIEKEIYAPKARE
jgi:transposase-like protein